MNDQVWWYLARASGIIAWLLLTASVMWGIVLSTDAFPRRRRPAWILDLHRWLGGLTILFIACHLTSLVADNYVQFDFVALLIPYGSRWRPGAVALGVLAAWSLVAVELTSLARRHLPRRIWRAIHLTSYGAFLLTSLHATFAGTDASNRLYVATTVATTAAVVWAGVYRLIGRKARPPASPTRSSVLRP